MNVALVLQIVTAAMQLAPLAASTVIGIKNLLSKDPNVPIELQALLRSTADDNAATLAAIQQWVNENPA